MVKYLLVDEDGCMTGFESLNEVKQYVEPGHVDEVSMVIGEDGSFFELFDTDPITAASCAGLDELRLRAVLTAGRSDLEMTPILDLIGLRISQNLLD